MVKGFYKDLLLAIFLVLLLLGVCVSIDYADNVDCVVNNSDTSMVNVTDNDTLVGVNESESNLVVKSGDRIHTIEAKKPTLPLISMWAKPSVRSGYSYTWYRFVWVDYCPNCHHYNCLLKNPKGVPEGEYTCAICDSDYCAVTGKEKYSWSNVYLRRA